MAKTQRTLLAACMLAGVRHNPGDRVDLDSDQLDRLVSAGVVHATSKDDALVDQAAAAKGLVNSAALGRGARPVENAVPTDRIDPATGNYLRPGGSPAASFGTSPARSAPELEATLTAHLVAVDARLAQHEARVSALVDSRLSMLAAAATASGSAGAVANDGLAAMRIDELKGLATVEGIDLGTAARKDEMVTTIRAARAARPSAADQLAHEVRVEAGRVTHGEDPLRAASEAAPDATSADAT